MLPIETLSEPIAVEDIYVSDLGGIEDAGDGNVRFIFCATQRSLYDNMSVERIVRVKLVTGPSLIWYTIRQTMLYFGVQCCGTVKGKMAKH